MAIPSNAKPSPTDNWVRSGPENTSAAKARTGMMPTPYTSNPVVRLLTGTLGRSSCACHREARLLFSAAATLDVTRSMDTHRTWRHSTAHAPRTWYASMIGTQDEGALVTEAA